MRNINSKIVTILLSVVLFSVSALVSARIPVWTFTPLTPTNISVPVNRTAIIQYTVTNQSEKFHTLIMSPMKGISQITTGAGVCNHVFPLPTKGASCILSLQVNGSQVTDAFFDGPIVCEQGLPLQCYRPKLRDNIYVKVTENVYTVGGTVSGVNSNGLHGTVVLQNNMGLNLSISTDGPFTFAADYIAGTPYNVTVLTHPIGETCTVNNGVGTISNADVTNITVTCLSNSHTIGGNLSGLNNHQDVVLQNNGGDNLTLTANGAFTFSTPLLSGSTYVVTVLTQPSGQHCSVFNGSGTVIGSDVTSVVVSCIQTASYTVGGTLTGLNNTQTVVLQNNGGDNLTLTVNGAFTFPTALINGSAYNVTVLTQPSGQLCTVTNGSDTLAGANVTNVDVNCIQTGFYTIGGTVHGLNSGQMVVLQNNGTNDLTLNTDGTFTFPGTLLNGSPYDVTVLTQSIEIICTVTNGSGSLAGSDITNVNVVCTLNLPYDEPFTGESTDLPWVLPAGYLGVANSACLTAGNNTGTIPACPAGQQGGYNGLTPDSPGQGVLLLTQAIGNQEGGIVFQSLFSMSQGLTIQFVAYSYAGGPTNFADGFSFFLINEANGVPTVLGPYGGGLGYGNNWNYSGAGIVGGYIGVGFDEFGQFSSASAIAPNVPNSIGIRGPTSNNNLLLNTPSTLTPILSCGNNCISSTPRSQIVNVNFGRNVYMVSISAAGIMSVSRNNIIINSNLNLNTLTGVPLPDAVFFGFAGSTGLFTNIHSVSNLLVATFGSLYSIGGTVSGLNALQTVTLQNNGGDNLPLTANGTFVFPSSALTSTNYNVTVFTQPVSQTCTVTNGTGTISTSNVTNVSVTCV
ncbi:lectin-like domain-containing protein [Legionella sp.]|uniref:lectin-like domain-containing protein n=1 Tax=Legionella sp. TaxID=459 RepID=UPI003C834A31